MDKQAIREEVIYLARQKPAVALERANVLVAELPCEVWTWSLRAHVNDSIGDSENAIIDIDQAIAIQFNEPGSHCDKARYCVKNSDFEGAIYSFSNAIEIGKKLQFHYHESLSMFMRAFCYCKTGDFTSAKKDLDDLDDDMQMWIDRLRSKHELLEACRNRHLD